MRVGAAKGAAGKVAARAAVAKARAEPKVALRVALAGFFLAQGSLVFFSGNFLLRKNIFFPEKNPGK